MTSDDELLELLRGAFESARAGDVARLTDLLAAGVPANLTNDHGDTLLILTVYHCHPAAVRLLIDGGADVHRVNDNGQTALGAAVFRSEPGLVEMLLGAGADPDGGVRSARMIAEFFDLAEMRAMLPPPPSPGTRP